MALEVDSTLGHYQVTALIGEGGMGQVLASLNHPSLADMGFRCPARGDLCLKLENGSSPEPACSTST